MIGLKPSGHPISGLSNGHLTDVAKALDEDMLADVAAYYGADRGPKDENGLAEDTGAYRAPFLFRGRAP